MTTHHLKGTIMNVNQMTPDERRAAEKKLERALLKNMIVFIGAKIAFFVGLHLFVRRVLR